MDITLSLSIEVVERARRRSESLGKSLDLLVQEYLEQFTAEADAEEWERLSREPKGNSRSWKFNRDEIHERR